MTPADFGLDPARYFIAADRVPPLVVEHATGRPAYVIEGNRLAPYRPTPRPPASTHAATLHVADAGLSFTLSIQPPEG